MLAFARIINWLLALVVFGVLRAATADAGFAAWAISLVVAIIVFYALRAVLVSPLVRAATKRASVQIIQHFAGGGDMGGAINIAKRLGLSANEAREVAEAHRDALIKEIAERILKEARHRYEKHRDREEVKRYLREQGVPEENLEKAVDRVVHERT